ncbi:hypothetical protein [Pimelobacter simplex]|uniref:Uncharacterized protein n=1 Tax=Nocardioides simplex TaxID=2045 RepID=A0A0C5XHH7_NOCSI|nr:hypothetical protein [Pimelobacter simplex]AJR18611.1 hypothetical protein KR76_19335 [Pimelobacter simplex]GEB16365.1 hypothetical protein NSI01_46800 [Pimelobacter simplex]SFM36068.1 hypothetical protein SAMN05421671_1477 [Pimelobacter simplex]
MRLTASLRTVVATLLVAAAVVLLPSSPASAAACSGTAGISVVVDPNSLGGGISAGCDSDGGGTAASNFADAGYRLEYSQAPGMNGFVCKINGRPADGDCMRTDAYWSLWWADGTSSTWTYSNRGVGGLRVPAGGVVAFSWHEGGGNAAPPDANPRRTAAAPPPKATTKPKPQPKPSAKPTRQPAATPSASATSATVSPTATPTPSASASSSAPATSATPSTAPEPTDPGSTAGVPSVDDITEGPDDASAVAPDPNDDGGFPVWLGAALAVAVLGGAAAVPILRRRRG